MWLRWLSLVLALAAVFTGCARKKRVPIVVAPAIGSVEIGMASWYGHPYHGRASSSGEIYDMEKLTAAHRTLPFGTLVRVLNLENGRSVQVRINDRGPFVEERIIDLSRTAAREIRMLGPGTAKVRLQVLALPERLPPGDYFAVQIGAFRDRSNAERRRKAMEARYGPARLMLRDGKPPLWRVLVGREATQADAAALAEKLRAELGAAFVVRVDMTPANHL